MRSPPAPGSAAERAALLMQSSGVGNCVNMLSLAKSCRFPLVMLVTMRGEWGEFNPWQVPMGSKTAAALELMDVLVYRVERAEDAAETVAAAIDIAYSGDLAARGAAVAAADRRQAVGEMIANDQPIAPRPPRRDPRSCSRRATTCCS